MAKVRILVGVAGADFSWTPGQVVEMSEKSAEAWCDGVRAERVEPRQQGRGRAGGQQPEQATQTPPEQATPTPPETTTTEAPEKR